VEDSRGRIEPDGSIRKEFLVQFAKAVRALFDRRELVADDPDLPNFKHRRFVRRGMAPCLKGGKTTLTPNERLIMATLDDAKRAGLTIRGHVNGVVSCSSQRRSWQLFQDAGWERIDYQHWRIPDDVYDLRVSLAYIKSSGLSQGKQFTYAARKLCESGALICEAPDLPKFKQVRFVKRG
jgi:hypothetical protein